MLLGGAISGESFSARLRRAISGAAARVRADIAFALIDVFIVIGAYTVALAVRMLDPGIQDVREYCPRPGQGHAAHHPDPRPGQRHRWSLRSRLGARLHRRGHEGRDRQRRCRVAGTRPLLRAQGFAPVTIVVPATVVVMGAFLTLAGMGLVRFRSRLFSFRKIGRRKPNPDRRHRPRCRRLRPSGP